ncbi:MAG TPA: DinB family protein [bacterium]|nr:DinB family protein [bacterium]
MNLSITEGWRTLLWNQYGAAIDTLENAIRACPADLWSKPARMPFWYGTYHTLFWLDLYLSGAIEGFLPPAPYGLEELDPAGVLPPRVYSQTELLEYLEHCREKAVTAIGDLNEGSATRTCRIGRGKGTYVELLLYTMRHVQHHSAQLNLILRQTIDSAPGWVSRAKRQAVAS